MITEIRTIGCYVDFSNKKFMKYFILKENLHDGYTMTYRNIGNGNLYFAHDSYKKNLLFLV